MFDIGQFFKFKNQIVVVKYGGNAMLNDDLKNSVLEDIVFLKKAGIKVVVVHGGGPEINALLKVYNKKSEFVAGLRVTDLETMEITQMALVGKVNTDLVGRLNVLGGKAVGLNGKDAGLLIAKKHFADVKDANGKINLTDIGFVGEVYKVNADLLKTLVDNDYIPVIAPVGFGDKGETFNINADMAAGEIAGALAADMLLMLTDVKGLYSNYPDENSFMHILDFEEMEQLMGQGKIDGGMIPKVRSCVSALQGGTKKAYILDGREKHSLLAKFLGDEKMGTEIIKGRK